MQLDGPIVFVIGLHLFALAVWTGRFRMWAAAPPYRGLYLPLLAPWACIAIDVVICEVLLRGPGPRPGDVVKDAIGYIALVLLGVGFLAAGFGHPHWALPPWFKVAMDRGEIGASRAAMGLTGDEAIGARERGSTRRTTALLRAHARARRRTRVSFQHRPRLRAVNRQRKQSRRVG
jgi:hypothetical protein